MIQSLYDIFKHWSTTGSVWLISDTHFDDPDRSIMGYTLSEKEQMDILKQKIHKPDTMIHLGDVGNPEYLCELKCRKVLILGNHDYTATKFKPYFDEIYSGPLFIGEKILLSHEPINLGNIAFNIHGHDHNPANDWSYNHINLAANVVNYQPINLGKLIKDGWISNVDGIHRQTIDMAIAKKIRRSNDGNSVL